MANPINDKHKWQTGTKFMEAVRNLRSLPEVGMQGMAVGDLQLQGEERWREWKSSPGWRLERLRLIIKQTKKNHIEIKNTPGVVQSDLLHNLVLLFCLKS